MKRFSSCDKYCNQFKNISELEKDYQYRGEIVSMCKLQKENDKNHTTLSWPLVAAIG